MSGLISFSVCCLYLSGVWVCGIEGRCPQHDVETLEGRLQRPQLWLSRQQKLNPHPRCLCMLSPVLFSPFSFIIQTQKGSNERLFILTRTHSIQIFGERKSPLSNHKTTLKQQIKGQNNEKWKKKTYFVLVEFLQFCHCLEDCWHN